MTDFLPRPYSGLSRSIPPIRRSALAEAIVRAAVCAMREASGAAEVADVRDKLRAVEVYARQRGADLYAANLITAQRIRTERRIGEMLRGTTVKGGERHKSSNGIYERRATLPPDGVVIPGQSSRSRCGAGRAATTRWWCQDKSSVRTDDSYWRATQA